MQLRVAVLFHSGYGHTAKQAEAVAAGARQVAGAEVDLISIPDLTEETWPVLDAADAIIFGSPTYMSGASAVFRGFVEATSARWADNLRWRDKIAAGFTNSGSMSGDKLNTLTELALFAAQHGMIWVGLAAFSGWNTSTGTIDDVNRLGSWLGAMAQSNNDQGPEFGPCPSDLRTAEALGRRVAEVTLRHTRGRLAEPEPAQPAAA
ncbi:flavodoxin family protein [Actinoplanes sp. NPDC020271]|uniref:flavodoxin family protein n=1 Tax=Actinoplanes sp. NPDC020271 TaxID=3363896 RepID=UPI00379254BE